MQSVPAVEGLCFEEAAQLLGRSERTKRHHLCSWSWIDAYFLVIGGGVAHSLLGAGGKFGVEALRLVRGVGVDAACVAWRGVY